MTMTGKFGPQLGIPFEDPVMIRGFLNALPQRKLNWLARVYLPCLLVLQHRYGLSGWLPVSQYAWEPDFESGTIYFLKEVALNLLGFNKPYMPDVLKRAVALRDLHDWRLKLAFKLQIIPADWDRTDRAIAEARLNDDQITVAERFGVTDQKVRAVIGEVISAKSIIKTPKHANRPALFAEQLAHSKTEPTWVGPRERVILDVLDRLAAGQTSTAIAAAIDTTPSYVRCIPIAARLDLQHDPALVLGMIGEAKIIDKERFAYTYRTYRARVRHRDHESLSPLEREYGHYRSIGLTTREAADELHLKTTVVGTYIELLMLDAFIGKNQRGIAVPHSTAIKGPLAVQLKPWGAHRDYTQRFVDRSAQLPRGEVDTTSFPLTEKMERLVEICRAAVSSKGIINNPAQKINLGLGLKPGDNPGYPATHWLIKKGFLVHLGGGKNTGTFWFVDRPTRVVANVLSRPNRVARAMS